MSSLPRQRSTFLSAVFTAAICFAAYACVISFRKAFNVAPYSGYRLAGMNYKDVLVISQLLGYMASKFYGIRFVSEMKRIGRGRLIFALIGFSWLAWLLFAIIPPPYNFWTLFLNGFPLGILWGVLFSYVEGRRATDFIGAALAVSFIFGPGLAKSTAQWVMSGWGVSEYWMPFITALIFFFPLLVLVFLLEKIPPPNEADIAHRTQRLPMASAERRQFLKTFLPGVVLLVIVYIFVTVLREVRDSFMADMWKASGASFKAGVFAQTESLISITILVLIAGMVLVRNNQKAFMISQLIMLAGFVLSGLVTWFFLQGKTDMFGWMTTVGLGLYMTYIPYNSILFERMLASFRYAGNVGFLIYLADAFGYLASVSVLLTKTVLKIEMNWLNFYTGMVIYSSLAGILCIGFCLFYFNRKHRTLRAGAPAVMP
ncbi:MAG TPA: DUF5690 family protein [Flavisolibacter sp.]|nr:DUF5690 family protein [Flavisolibacter sp.]